jgi:LysM repeat protein
MSDAITCRLDDLPVGDPPFPVDTVGLPDPPPPWVTAPTPPAGVPVRRTLGLGGLGVLLLVGGYAGWPSAPPTPTFAAPPPVPRSSTAPPFAALPTATATILPTALLPATATVPPPVVPTATAPAWGTVVIQPGDTLAGIAERTGRTATTLAAANGLDNPHLLTIGQILSVPPPDWQPPAGYTLPAFVPPPTATPFPTATPPPPTLPTLVPTATALVPTATATPRPAVVAWPTRTPCEAWACVGASGPAVPIDDNGQPRPHTP